MTSDRDLLQALFVQQLGFAPAGDVMAAGAQWLVQRETGASLGHVLQSRGVLDARQLQLVDALVSEAIAAHGGDAAVTLRSLPPLSQDSLSGLASTLRPGEAGATPQKLDLTSTSFDSLETPENIGVEAKGRYTFDTGRKGKLEELGRGGAGRVVVARDHFLARDVAMKELHREITQNLKFDTLHVRNLEARFLREARVTGQLEHPAIVPVYELGRRRDGTMYYTMRRVRGRTLAQALTDTRSPEGRLALLPDLLTACRAVAAAHHREVVHRDLKPQNVMLGPHGETYVMDWGLARVMGRADRRARTVSGDGTVQLAPDLTGGRDLGPVGTPSYMSPEQAQGDRDELDARSDVWGLGAMLFEILTGRAPYVGKSPWDVLADVRSKPPPPVRSLAPAAPPELVAVCERALAWNRDHRYPNAGELALELEAFLAGKRVLAYDYTLREVAGRVLKRHRAKATLALATLVAMLVLGAFSAVSVGRERDEARQMARFFLADVAPTLAGVPGTTEVLGQLSHSALESFSAGVDPRSGARDDRLLLARTWNSVAHQHWRQGRRPEARDALAQSQRMIRPLLLAYPDDPDVLAADLQHEIWRADLILDEGGEAEALSLLEGQLERAMRGRALAPVNPAVLAAHTLLLSRISLVRYSKGEMRLALEISRRAKDAASEYYRVAPDDPAAAVALLDETDTLALGLFSVGQRIEALAALEQGVRLAQAMRARHDSRELQGAHASLLASLARGLHPVNDREQQRTVLADARRLLADILAADPARNHQLADAADLALLDGDLAGAWAFGERIETLELGAEYEEAVLSTAFATGQDELIRRHARAPVPGSPMAIAFYGALVESLAGNAQLARSHLARCAELKCADQIVWFPAVLLERLGTRSDPTAVVLRRLAENVPLSIGGSAALTKGLAELDAHLGGAP